MKKFANYEVQLDVSRISHEYVSAKTITAHCAMKDMGSVFE